MADHSTPSPMPMPADTHNRPLLSALTRWWSSASQPTTDPVLGYESALPWVLDDTPDDAGHHLR
ncbi:hypothetical protein ACG04R_00515 [Roseateles sp. BYS78W]|uniref:Uncharacterized protein n=1 Tax=Pelomonas candidula TaxID=3299025 RepID=A0ABW7H5E8_9BURK